MARGVHFANSEKRGRDPDTQQEYAAEICEARGVKHNYRHYSVTDNYDRVCVHLRKGDFEALRASGVKVSAWIRTAVSQHCNYLRKRQRQAERLQREQLTRIMRDPNL